MPENTYCSRIAFAEIDEKDMKPVSVDYLVKLFRSCPFTVKVEGSFCDSSILIIQLNFYSLTQLPIHIVGEDISNGSSNVFTLTYWLDIYEFLQNDLEPYKSINGWVNGIMSPIMRSMFCHSLAHGEYVDAKEYSYVEYVLEYYFFYVSMNPRVDVIHIDGAQYKEQRGLAVSEEVRKQMLSFFHMQKTKELYNLFGMNAVHWMNHIKQEILNPVAVKNTEQLDEAMAKIMAIRSEAKMLKETLKEEEADRMAELKKRLLNVGLKKPSK